MSDARPLTESLFEKAFNDAPIGMAIVSLQGRFLKVNGPLAEIVGYTPSELVQLGFPDITHAEDKDKDIDGLRRLVAGEIRTYRTEKRYLHKSGRVVWILLAASLVRDERGAPLHVVSQMQDITELKDALSALRESEARYRFLVDNTPDVIYSLDRSGRFTAVNRSACEVVRRPEAQILGKHFRELGFVEDELRAYEAYVERAMAGELVRADVDATLPNGERRAYNLTLTPVRHEGVVVAIRGVSRDVTEAKRLEAQLRQAQKMQAVGRLAGGIAHDFNNIMTVIKAYANFASSKLRPGEPPYEDVQEICKAAERAEHLTRQLLAFSRKSLVELRNIDLNQAVLDMQNMLARLVGEDVEIDVNASPSIGSVRADMGQIEQVLTNLVVNARDAMPKGGKLTIETANAEVDGRLRDDGTEIVPGPYVVLSVTDSGEGIPPEVREHLFEPFFTTKKPGHGTGLGLATVYGIVKQAGGFITYETEVGRGTTFRIHLPRAKDSAASDPTTFSRTPENAVGGGRSVLLVEDEPALRRAARRMLEQSGFRVVEAGNGRQALDRVHEAVEPFDVIVTDVVMPVMNGKDLVDAVHESRPDLPVVYMSGYTEDSIVDHGVLNPDTIFLPKPFSAEELIGKVRLALAIGPSSAADVRKARPGSSP